MRNPQFCNVVERYKQCSGRKGHDAQSPGQPSISFLPPLVSSSRPIDPGRIPDDASEKIQTLYLRIPGFIKKF